MENLKVKFQVIQIVGGTATLKLVGDRFSSRISLNIEGPENQGKLKPGAVYEVEFKEVPKEG